MFMDSLGVLSDNYVSFTSGGINYYLVSDVAPGTDMRFDEEKIKAAWNYINKIWNASRFVLSSTSTLKEINLENGINLIYGENEAGKSTLIKFIINSFYGISKRQSKKLKNTWISLNLIMPVLLSMISHGTTSAITILKWQNIHLKM